MRSADTSDLKWYNEDGFNTSRIMKQAHMLASTNAEFGRKSYSEYLSEALEQQWESAKDSRDAVQRAGGPDAVRGRDERRQKREKEKEASEQLKQHGTKKRTKIFASFKKKHRERIEEDPTKAFDGFGKTWTTDEDSHALGGPQAGQQVCYMYYYEMDDAALDEMATA